MNHIGAGTFDSVMLASIRADVLALTQDPTTAVTAIIETPGAASFDPRTGLSAPALTQDTTTGWLSDLTLREVEESGGKYQVGDRRLLVPPDDLTTDPVVGSTFRIASTRYAVLSAVTDPLSAMWTLIGRRTTA